MTPDLIEVSSHVGRDILQASQLFKTVEAAVWEYVVNSLQYVEVGIRPEVMVELNDRKHQIIIADNGRGMDVNDLQHFFTMHAENVERRKGTPGRGKFGTGKSAAFGIGNALVVDTVKDGVRNVLELTREDIEASTGSNVPTRWISKNEAALEAPNGTVITIKGLLNRRLKTESMVRTFERHLSFWRAMNPSVVVGSHVCEPWEPEAVETQTFEPPEALAAQIGTASLVVKTARRPLDVGFRGIAITAGAGNLVAIETAGVDTKEFGNYLFGEIDVPLLEEPAFEGTVVAFDSTRSLTLNYDHPVAAALLGFIGSKLEKVRKEMVDQHRQAKKEQEAERLADAGSEIAKVLNSDLRDVTNRFEEMRNIRRRTETLARTGSEEADDDGLDYVEGDQEPGLFDRVEPRDRTDTPTIPSGEDDPGIRKGKANPEGTELVSPTGSKGSKATKSGGLSVDFANLGEDEERSLYDFDRKNILINLDHPAVAAAKGISGVDDPAFRRLTYEIAFTQYALAVAREIYERDQAITADDVLFEVRDALRRVTAKAAFLYSTD
jgi:hypothetical protein